MREEWTQRGGRETKRYYQTLERCVGKVKKKIL